MECIKCGASNALLKKSCYRCGAILSGYTINNVTGEYGFRNPDGTFTKGPTEARIIVPRPIGYLRHEPTGYSLAVYKPISRFQALMLRWCFGVKFERI